MKMKTAFPLKASSLTTSPEDVAATSLQEFFLKKSSTDKLKSIFKSRVRSSSDESETSLTDTTTHTLETVLSEEDYEDKSHVFDGDEIHKLQWCFKKPMSEERFFRYLSPSLAKGHVTNDGPLQAVLEEKILDFCITSTLTTVSSTIQSVPILTSNGTAALHALVTALSLKENRTLRWVTQAFTFPSSCQGPLQDAQIVDIDPILRGPSMKILENTKDTFDGIIVTNMFGLDVGILEYEQWCKSNNKLLVLDNAATPIGIVSDGRSIHQVGDGSIVSLHETKPIGRGEGGIVFVDGPLEPFVRRAISFGYDMADRVRIHHRGCSNWRMSDIAAAAIADHIDYMIENDWKERHKAFTKLAMELMTQKSIELALPVTSPTILSCLFLKLNKPQAEDILHHMQEYGVEAKHYYRPLTSRKEAPESWKWYDHTICLPYHLGINEMQLQYQLKVFSMFITH